MCPMSYSFWLKIFRMPYFKKPQYKRYLKSSKKNIFLMSAVGSTVTFESVMFFSAVSLKSSWAQHGAPAC